MCGIKGYVCHLQENVVRDFELNELYHQCKKHPLSKKSRKSDLNSAAEADENKQKTE